MNFSLLSYLLNNCLYFVIGCVLVCTAWEVGGEAALNIHSGLLIFVYVICHYQLYVMCYTKQLHPMCLFFS